MVKRTLFPARQQGVVVASEVVLVLARARLEEIVVGGAGACSVLRELTC